MSNARFAGSGVGDADGDADGDDVGELEGDADGDVVAVGHANSNGGLFAAEVAAAQSTPLKSIDAAVLSSVCVKANPSIAVIELASFTEFNLGHKQKAHFPSDTRPVAPLMSMVKSSSMW